jgi:hypothetical protein
MAAKLMKATIKSIRDARSNPIGWIAAALTTTIRFRPKGLVRFAEKKEPPWDNISNIKINESGNSSAARRLEPFKEEFPPGSIN